MDLIPLFTFGIAVVVFLGAAVVYLRGSKDKGTIATLEKNNEALTERVTILEASDIAKDARIEGLTQANKVLTNTVNSSELIINLSTDLQAHHDAAMSSIDRVNAALASLPTHIAEALAVPLAQAIKRPERE